jgi:uncharacterized membrane protein YcaP (DUF421 family)
MEFVNKWWGINENISPAEITARAVVMFILTFLVIRFTGMRSFRQNNPLDLVIAFLIGGILSRGVVGATPFFTTLFGAVALLILQKILFKLSFVSKWFEITIKGERFLIYENGKFIRENMRKADVTKLEVYEDLRVQFQTESLEQFEKIYVEKTGEISFVKKDKAT